MVMTTRIILWLRQDLRLHDNPALTAACAIDNAEILPIYIHNPQAAGGWAQGGASLWWLHHSLKSLQTALGQKLGLPLVLRHGDSAQQLQDIAVQWQATHVFWHRRYEPWAIAQDTVIKKQLQDNGMVVESFNGRLLVEPWQVKNLQGGPYKVFTPFWKNLSPQFYMGTMGDTLPLPSKPQPPQNTPPSDNVDDWQLLPTKPNWAQGFDWQVGEAAAQAKLANFVNIAGAYKDQRDFPDIEGTSRLSPHLHFGEISPRQIWHSIRQAQLTNTNKAQDAQFETYLKEVVWREFAYHLLYHFPHTPTHALNSRYDDFPWAEDAQLLQAWQQGQTGIPIVDAGMRQLWQTGWMHNRVRMIVASFLVKHLLQPWQAGADWFWDTLLDADLASNTMGWQWSAGCGADAAPYFRVFNPVLQAQKFDADGAYIKQFVPELANMPSKYIHAPWLAPALLHPKNYPAPIIDIYAGRDRALKAFAIFQNQ